MVVKPAALRRSFRSERLMKGCPRAEAPAWRRVEAWERAVSGEREVSDEIGGEKSWISRKPRGARLLGQD
jgi:hypothetical protein